MVWSEFFDFELQSVHSIQFVIQKLHAFTLKNFMNEISACCHMSSDLQTQVPRGL